MAGALSVVIPTRNSARYLPELLQSLRGQDAQPAEYLFIDGNSTDGTRDLIARFQPGPPVRLVESPPRGVYPAWNEGIAAAGGEWIWVVCSDDLVRPNGLRLLAEAAARTRGDVGIVGGFVEVIDPSGRCLYDVRETSPLAAIAPRLCTEEHVRDAGLEAALIYLFRAHFVSFMAHLFRKRVWEERPFDAAVGPAADVDWTMEAHLRGWARHQLPATVAAWRRQSESSTGRFPARARLQAHQALQASCLPRLAGALGLTPLELEAWRGARPAQDVFDWMAVMREARGLRERLSAAGSVIDAAGVGSIIALALRCAGWRRDYVYRRPAQQFLRLFGPERLKRSISSIGKVA